MSDSSQGSGWWQADDGKWFPSPAESSMAVERYKAFRSQIEAESTLVGVRLGWLIAAEAFLAATYATVLTVPTEPAETWFKTQANQLYSVIPIAGMVLAFLVGISIWAALWAMGRLRDAYERPQGGTQLPAGFPGGGPSVQRSTTQGRRPRSWCRR